MAILDKKVYRKQKKRYKALLKERSRHLPIFPGRRHPSIFGTTQLNYCVRNGNRWDLSVIGTGYGCGAGF